jgi:phosphoglycolate phosphatase
MTDGRAPAQLRAVIFDFDGTLADSYAAIAASINHVRARYGLPPLEIGEVKRHVGRGAEYLIENTVGSHDVSGDLQRYRHHHPSVMRPLTHLLPGALDTLRAVREGGRRAGVCSNKPRPFTEEILKVVGLAEYVEAVVGPEDAARPKPAPDMLLLAMRQLGVTPEQTLYVGDMTVDIETARGAGVAVWVVPTGSDTLAALEAARPDRILGGLDELARWLRDLTSSPGPLP